jgi:DNA mismatch repair ATPase MutS
VTGPNSGGKTAFCKTLAQIQVLAQIGCYIPADRATMTVADRIFYQVPEISHLTDGEGRFGTELKRTKAIFLASTPRSLVIMDELSEGTTNEEKLEISVSILDGFREKGNSTVLITHNHELVDFYQRRAVGQARQVEFRNELPTYRLIEGISRVSHADRIAKKIGFSKDDIAKYLTGES